MKQHLFPNFWLSPAPTFSCGKAEQTVEHVRQDCQQHKALGEKVWPQKANVEEELYGSVDQLQQTATFI